MSKITVESVISYRSLMNKSKSDLADMVLQYADLNGKLHGKVKELEDLWWRSRPMVGPGSVDE